ncbi:MAG: GTP-binding protein [Promethearchaeia archaeon]
MPNRPRVLNVLFAGHSQHGKSSLIEAIVGKFPDILDYELAHGTTVSLKTIQFLLKKQNLQLNILDSPGHADFQSGIALGLEIADLLVLVISGSEGFQARTYWLVEKALEKGLPFIVAATKMDLPNASIEKISKGFKKYEDLKRPIIIETSAKENFGIEELIEKISIYVKRRDKKEDDPSFIILGFEEKKGLGELINIGILSGKISVNQWITDKIKIKNIFSLKGAPQKEAIEGDIVQISLNVIPNFDLGSKYNKGKFISPKIVGILAEIQPRKEFYISIKDPIKFKVALDVLDKMKKIFPNFDYYFEKNEITIQTLGDLQFDFLKERLEDLIEFEIIGSKIKGIITINKMSRASHNSASVRVVPRIKHRLTVNREGSESIKMYDMLGASAAYEAFHLDGLHVDIYSGKNEDDIAQAIAKAIEKVKIIKIIPYQDVIVKVENYHDIFPLIDKYNVEVLHQTQDNAFFLQVKNENFESFFNSLMKVSKGTAEINLFKFEHDDIVLAVDPGTRHFGFCLIKKGELPSLWFVNLKSKLDDKRSHEKSRILIAKELDLFLQEDKDQINKIFIGNGPGSKFIIDFFIEYFNIPCENYSCDITDRNSMKSDDNNKMKNRFKPPDIYLIDEFKTTKEAIFHLHRGELVSEVESKGFVDHAIAALLIAKRGLKGEIIQIQKKPMKVLHDYIIEHYAGSYSFATIHNINSLEDIQPGMYLRVKDSSKLDSNISNGEVVAFIGFGNAYRSVHVSTLSGNRMILKFTGDVKVRRDFFKILSPVKERIK